MREVASLRNLFSGFVTTLKRLFESVMGTIFCLLLYFFTASGVAYYIVRSLVVYMPLLHQ